MLDPKDQDWRCKLILAYYSMSLVPALLIEGCLATLIKSAVRSGTYDGKPVELQPFFGIISNYAELF